MSEYEKQRLDRIRGNQQKLRELGLAPVRRAGVVSKKRKRRAASVKPRAVPTRRSTRRRGAVMASLAESGSEQSGSDSDAYMPSGGETSGSEESGDEWAEIPLPVVRAPRRSAPGDKKGGAKGTAAAKGASGLLSCEAAKTGRSSCRKCMAKIEKGAVRIGMQGWIAGRKAVTWQHPACFASQIAISRESSGRSMCKATKVRFQKGGVRVGFTSHSTTSNVKVSALGSVLSALLREGEAVAAATECAPIEWGVLLDPSQWEGWGSLASGGAEASAIREQVESARAGGEGVKGKQGEKGGASKGDTAASTSGEKGGAGASSALEQPAVGKKTRAKGRVAWKWGSHVCFGTLLSARETGSHCFARTHKGNTKTLAKGKAYWWMVEGEEK